MNALLSSFNGSSHGHLMWFFTTMYFKWSRTEMYKSLRSGNYKSSRVMKTSPLCPISCLVHYEGCIFGFLLVAYLVSNLACRFYATVVIYQTANAGNTARNYKKVMILSKRLNMRQTWWWLSNDVKTTCSRRTSFCRQWLRLVRIYRWWRHQMETFSVLLAICAGNSPVTGEFPAQRPVTQSFNVFFDLRLNKRLSKQ